MASILSQRASSPKFMKADGCAYVETDKVVLGASPGVGTPAAADTIDFLIPAGARMTDLEFQFDDCDTGTTFVFSAGYRAATTGSTLAAAPAYFAAAGQTTGQAGGRLVCAFKPIKFEEDVYVSLTVGTASTGISGNPEIHVIASYNCEGAK